MKKESDVEEKQSQVLLETKFREQWNKNLNTERERFLGSLYKEIHPVQTLMIKTQENVQIREGERVPEWKDKQ